MNGMAILGLFVLASACTSNEQARQADLPTKKAAKSTGANQSGNRMPEIKASVSRKSNNIAPWDASGCGDDDYKNEQLQRHPELMGLSQDDILAAYGAPSAREEFKIGEPVGRFYGDYAKRSGAQAKNAGEPARALTWTKSNCNFTIFFLNKNKAWLADNAFEWGVDADF